MWTFKLLTRSGSICCFTTVKLENKFGESYLSALKWLKGSYPCGDCHTRNVKDGTIRFRKKHVDQQGHGYSFSKPRCSHDC